MSGTHPSSIRILAFLLIGVGIFGYSLFSFRHLFHGPSIAVESPVEGQRVEGGVVDIVGTAPFATDTSIDGRTLYVDGAGRFHEKLVLSKGPAIITLYAKDRFGRETTKQITVYAQ